MRLWVRSKVEGGRRTLLLRARILVRREGGKSYATRTTGVRIADSGMNVATKGPSGSVGASQRGIGTSSSSVTSTPSSISMASTGPTTGASTVTNPFTTSPASSAPGTSTSMAHGSKVVKGFGTTQPYHYSRTFQVRINHPSP